MQKFQTTYLPQLNTTHAIPAIDAQATNNVIDACEPDNSVAPTINNQSNSDQVENIEVPSANNHDYRHYDKQFYCMYCEKPRGKLKKHLLAMHKEEDEVLQMETESDPQKKTMVYERIRNIGNHLHNLDVIKSGKGQLCVSYRPRGHSNVRAVDYGPCPYCYAYYPKRELWRHNTSCKFSTHKKERKRALTVASRMLLPMARGTSSTLLQLTEAMRNDSVTRIVKSDSTILAYGEKLCTKHGHDKDQHNYIRQKLREVARLVQELRKQSGDENKHLEDFVYPSSFHLIANCCKYVAGYDEGTNSYATPSLALKIGHILQKCLKIVVGKGIETRNKELQCRAEELGRLFEINWTDDISSNALRTLHHSKRNTGTSVLPLANDVKLLSEYLRAEAENMATVLKGKDDIVAWIKLNEITLAQLILFNRRRAGEVSKMTLDDYDKKELSNTRGSLDGCLSQVEKELCKIFYRTEIIAKRGRISPVLFTKRVKTHLDLLIMKRNLIDNPTNMFLFPTRTSSTHIRGTDCLRVFAKACGAEAPERLRSTKLRKHIATMSQVLNLQENELDVLAQFLGHDIRVHREFYRLPEATVQVAKVSKLLLMMESGIPPERGTRIEDISLNENEYFGGMYSSTDPHDSTKIK